MENTNKLTTKQQFWLDHITQAKDLGLSLSAYAKQQNINLKALYNYQTVFRKKGIVESESRFTQLAPIKPNQSMTQLSTIARVTLRNGIYIELPVNESGVEALLQKVSKL